MIPPTFPLDVVAAAAGPLVQLGLGADGRPDSAVAAMLVPTTPAKVWAVVVDLATLPRRVPMIHKVKLDGNRVTLALKFKVSLFSAGFGFVADAAQEEGRVLELKYVSGEPRAIHIRFELWPAPDGRGTVVSIAIGFDIHSLGWLVNFFLKHHPEIQFGVFPGSALSLLDAVARAAML